MLRIFHILSLVVLPAAVLVAGCAGAPARAVDEPSLARPADPVVARLRDGGYVIYIRHGKTDATFQDKQERANWWKSCDPRIHRPLSDDGRAQMMLIGAQLREQRIPVAKVVTSEYCRALDSGLLLQLMPVETNPALNYADAQRYAKRNDVDIADGMRTLFSTVPPAGWNTILVGHVHGFTPPLDPAFAQLQEAESVVLKPLGEGRFEVAGRIVVEKWALREKK